MGPQPSKGAILRRVSFPAVNIEIVFCTVPENPENSMIRNLLSFVYVLVLGRGVRQIKGETLLKLAVVG